MNERYRDNIILRLTLDFSVMIIEYSEKLESLKRFVVARQLIRAGTSIGANAREAQNAESDRHFISKFKTALREADETVYWLEICNRSKSYPDPPQELMQELESIIRVINKIISTTKKKGDD